MPMITLVSTWARRVSPCKSAMQFQESPCSGVYQVEHFHLIPMAAEQLRRVCVKLPLAVGDNGGLSPADDIEDGRRMTPLDLPVPDAPNTAMCRLSRVSHRQADGFAAPLA